MSWLSVVIWVPSPTATSSNCVDVDRNGVYSSTFGTWSVMPDTVTPDRPVESASSDRSHVVEPGREQPTSPTQTRPRIATEAGILRTGTV